MEVDRERIGQIACSTGRSATTIQQYVAEIEQFDWNEPQMSEVWNERGPSMMSGRDGLTLYGLVRALRPKVCVETGVGGGCSSTYVLTALERNGAGELFSIDVEGPHQEHYGELIPTQLRSRWNLKIQNSKPLLPELLQGLERIELFVHDSQHTFRHMRWEYELAWEYLRFGGCLASHDVLTTSAFDDFRHLHDREIRYGGVVGNFGFMIKQDRGF